MNNSSISNIRRRSMSLLIIFCIFFTAITARLAYIQFSWKSELQDKAITQWTRETGVYPKRGTIFDRNGMTLAVSVTRYSLQATPNDIYDSEAVAMLLSPILNMTTEAIAEKLDKTNQAIVWVKRLLTDSEADQIKNLEIKGLELVDEPARVYPYNDLASQVLGFVMKYAEPNGHPGQEGVELYYNSDLIGEPGAILKETDNTGKEIPNGSEIYVEAQNGSNIVLTLDATLQSYLEEVAEKYLEKFQADNVYAICSNPNTGEILAMVNYPTYNVNEPPRDLSITEMQQITKNMTCLMNFDPGSTFKPFILAAAIEEGVVEMDDEFYCPGYRIVDGQKINCADTRGHSLQTTQDGLNNSCNPVFMDIGERLGKERLYNYIEAFGFGQKTGIDVAGEESGILISEENAQHRDWITMCFGQAIAVTAIQMITAFNAVINGGYMIEPHLLKSINRTVENQDGTTSTETLYTAPIVNKGQIISSETSATVKEALKVCVLNGSAQYSAVNGYLTGGKTGTSQTYTDDGRIDPNRNLASFIAYGPYDDTQLSVYFLVDNPQVSIWGSVVAGPAVGEFLKKAFAYLEIEPTEPLKNQTWTPYVIGLELEDAMALLESRNFDVVLQGRGTLVVDQSVQAWTYVPNDTVIVITLEYGTIPEGTIKVPNVTGMTIAEANKTMYMKGLKFEVAGDGPVVTDQSILPGTPVEKGTTVIGYFGVTADSG